MKIYVVYMCKRIGRPDRPTYVHQRFFSNNEDEAMAEAQKMRSGKQGEEYFFWVETEGK